ncbi:MAG: hypothetical protein EOO46_16165 [Flavobacterium sp.]|nr:MAG: hypothetical protein EOO46_16165 [Flavobacterium sp.]
MKNTIFLIVVLLYFSNVQAQTIFEFQPLRILDTITQKTIDKIKVKDYVKNTHCFFSEIYDTTTGLFLFKKIEDKWIVYDYNDFVSNYTLSKHTAYSKRYVSINVVAMRSGMGENYYGWLVLFDLEKASYIILNAFSHNSGEYSDKTEFKQECTSKILYIKNNTFSVTKICDVKKEDKNYCTNCLDSGVYKIENDTLKKIQANP